MKVRHRAIEKQKITTFDGFLRQQSTVGLLIKVIEYEGFVFP